METTSFYVLFYNEKPKDPYENLIYSEFIKAKDELTAIEVAGQHSGLNPKDYQVHVYKLSLKHSW